MLAYRKFFWNYSTIFIVWFLKSLNKMLEDYEQTLEMFNLYHLVSTIIISSINTSFDPYCWKVKIDFKIFNCMSVSYILFIVLLCLTIKYSYHVNLVDLVYDCFSEKYIYNDTLCDPTCILYLFQNKMT